MKKLFFILLLLPSFGVMAQQKYNELIFFTDSYGDPGGQSMLQVKYFERTEVNHNLPEGLTILHFNWDRDRGNIKKDSVSVDTVMKYFQHYGYRVIIVTPSADTSLRYYVPEYSIGRYARQTQTGKKQRTNIKWLDGSRPLIVTNTTDDIEDQLEDQ